MHGKICLRSFIVLIFHLLGLLQLFACGEPEDKKGVIGEAVSPISEIIAVNVAGVEKSQMFYFDQPTSRILKLGLEPLNVESFLSVPITSADSNHFVLPGKNADYVVSLAKQSFYVIDNEGHAQENPLSFQGTPISTAYDREHDMIIVYDDLQSIGIVSLTPKGDIQDSWLGGPLLGANHSIRAGDVDQQGHLILYFSDHKIGIVDLQASISKKSWVFTDFTLADGFEGVNWLAAIPGSSFVMVAGSGSIGIIDTASKATISKHDLSSFESIRVKSRNAVPHLISYGAEDDEGSGPDDVRLWTASVSGELERMVLPDSMRNVAASYYNFDAKILNLTVLSKDMKDPKLYNMRLPDGLVMNEFNIPDQALLAVGTDFLVAVFPSSLGYIEATKISDKSRQELRSFNIPFFQNQ